MRVSRVIRGPVETVWRAHHDKELVQRWLLGPDGWSMPVCDLAAADGTLLSLLITYPSVEVRDAVLATGMTDGMEANYRRLETEVLVAA